MWSAARPKECRLLGLGRPPAARHFCVVAASARFGRDREKDAPESNRGGDERARAAVSGRPIVYPPSDSARVP